MNKTSDFRLEDFNALREYNALVGTTREARSQGESIAHKLEDNMADPRSVLARDEFTALVRVVADNSKLFNIPKSKDVNWDFKAKVVSRAITKVVLNE